MIKHLSELEDIATNFKVKPRVVLAVAHDETSLGALFKCHQKGLVEPILVGDKGKIIAICKEANFDLTDIEVINVIDEEKAVEKAVRYVSAGRADILVKGKVKTPVFLRRVLNKEWGLATGGLLSHLAILELEAYHKLFALTDVALNIAPDLNAKIGIINNSVQFLNKLGIKEPKVAVLGAIEIVNTSMSATMDAALLSKMNQRGQIKNCLIDGPLAFDNAVSLASAKYKGIKSDVAGDTDLLLMPDIEVGNVLYKSLLFFAHAKAAAVVLGAKAPIVLTSRSDSEDVKFYSICWRLR